MKNRLHSALRLDLNFLPLISWLKAGFWILVRPTSLLVATIICWIAFSVLAQTLPKAAPPTVISLDMCADQYLLGLMPHDKIVALSSRAHLHESYYQDRAIGLRRVKANYESILALKPDVVVRTYGGDYRLVQALEARGIRVVQINEVHSFSEARTELIRLGQVLEQSGPAQIEVRQFDKALKVISPIGQNHSVLYYTPSGFSAGPDTMIGDMLIKAGYHLETQNSGYFYVGPEVFLSLSPDTYALGFFDDKRQYRRSVGRSARVTAKINKKQNIVFPQRAIACAGWFNIYDLKDLTAQGGYAASAPKPLQTNSKVGA